GFYARSAGMAAPHSVPDEAAAANLVALHLALGLGSSVLVCVPVPADMALPEGTARDAVDRATHEADEAGIHGPDVTPWMLARIAAITNGASVRANTALIINNARVAGRLARALVRETGRAAPDAPTWESRCGSTREVPGRTGKRSCVPSAPTSTIEGCAPSSS